MAENFKLQTGTWVSVGAVRAKLTDALGGLARDVVLTGDGEEKLGALLVPFRPAIAALVPGGAEMSDANLFTPSGAARRSRRTARRLQREGDRFVDAGAHRHGAGGASTSTGEATDKGSVNQRAVLRERADLVARLYEEGPEVIRSGR